MEAVKTETSTYMRNLIDLVQRTDLSYAQIMQQVEQEIQIFTSRMQALYDSFNDNFPLYSEDVGALGENYNPHMGRVTDEWKLLDVDNLTDITFMECV